MVQKLAVAYYRTSSAANVGEDKDSEKRQRAAVMSYAKSVGIKVVREFYDAAVSGADPVQGRPGFSEMLEYMLGNGARTVLVESPDRFARELIVQIAGHELLKTEGIELIPTTAPTFFTEDTATAEMVRNILGAVSQFDRKNLVTRLRRARDRKSAELGHRIEGPKHLAELRPNVVGLAQALNRMRKSGHYTNPDIMRLFEKLGIRNSNGKPFSVVQVRRMVLGPKVPAASPRDYLFRLTETGDIDPNILNWFGDKRFLSWARTRTDKICPSSYKLEQSAA
jgi:DNA invertase Pin-like site-specific DNA recombinase